MAIAAPLVFSSQLALAQSSDLRAGFEAVIDGLNDNSFREFHDAMSEREFLGRVYGTHVISNEAKQAMASGYRELIEASFITMFPPTRSAEEAGGEIIGTIVGFTEQGGTARAIVRFDAKGHRYTWQSYDLVSSGGNVRIVDFWDYYQGAWFSEFIGDSLIRVMPAAESVAAVLEMPNPGEGRLFQVGELLKTVRDGNPLRYFEIFDGLEEELRQEPYIAILNFRWTRMLGDPGRRRQATALLTEVLPEDPRFSLGLAEFYIQARRFEDAIVELDRFAEALGSDDGVVNSLKATASMALGEFADAQATALAATQAEPDLELAWWTLLRTRTAAEDYAGATEALTQLEERFGHLLIPQKLRRDPFLKVLIDKQAYVEWRAARDAA